MGDFYYWFCFEDVGYYNKFVRDFFFKLIFFGCQEFLFFGLGDDFDFDGVQIGYKFFEVFLWRVFGVDSVEVIEEKEEVVVNEYIKIVFDYF